MPALNSGFQLLVDSAGFEVWECTINNTADNQDTDEEAEMESRSNFYTLLNGQSLKKETDVPIYTNIPIEVFSAGDLAQLMVNFGRDGYSGCWCCFCDLSKRDWQDANHAKGNLWSVATLKIHLATIADETDSKKRKGVRQEILLPAIDHAYNTFLSLHTLIGLGNCALDSLMDDLQSTLEVYTIKYWVLERDYNKKIEEEKTAQQLRDSYGTSTKLRLAAIKLILKGKKQQTNRLELEAERDAIKENKKLLITTKASINVNAIVASPRILKPYEGGVWKFLFALEPDALLVQTTGLLYHIQALGGPGAKVKIVVALILDDDKKKQLRTTQQQHSRRRLTPRRLQSRQQQQQ